MHHGYYDIVKYLVKSKFIGGNLKMGVEEWFKNYKLNYPDISWLL